jgi:hypothetical protein
MDARLAMLDNTGYAASCVAVGFVPVQPYVNGENGVPCENSDRGSDAAAAGRNDAVLAAAGWTPSGYVAAQVARAKWLSAHPVMAGKSLSVAFFTPGNWPRVDDSGQVVASVDSLALSRDLLTKIEASYTTGPVLYGDTTFGLNPSKPEPNVFVRDLKKPAGELVYQVANQAMTQAQFNAVVAAMPQDVARWEIHPEQVAMLPTALAALAGGSGFGG